MNPRHSLDILKERRRELRKNQTPQEKRLWSELRKGFLGVKFKRQYSIGGYIADFYCTKYKLIIELDGSVHNREGSKEYDQVRNKYFESLNYKVLRFSNNEIEEDTEKVIVKIKENLKN